MRYYEGQHGRSTWLQIVAFFSHIVASAGEATGWDGALVQDEQPWPEAPRRRDAGREAGVACWGLCAEHGGLHDGDGLRLQPRTPTLRKETSQMSPEHADDTPPDSSTASVSPPHAAQPERRRPGRVASHQNGAMWPVCPDLNANHANTACR